ncbi:MAG: hypothetical protein HY686_04275 [Chloroflexi bacterium]|nr:hypothetical protein [Chloroflexota bacterium]
MPGPALSSKRYQVSDYLEANELDHRRGWTDGLPIIPPTEELVGAFLAAAGRAPGDVVGAEPTKGKALTAEKVAINAIMAGCLPEHMPVVLAAVDAMSQDPFNLHAITVSTGGAAVLAVVNGPVARELGMNSGVSLFGPGPRANAAIGRAIRLLLMNLTGAVPGILDKGTLGHPGKYTYCIAEAEEASPWEPLHEERSLPRGSSAVTVFAALAPWQVSNHASNTPEGILASIADVLKAVGPGQGEVVVLLCPEHAAHFAQARWSKAQVKEFLARTAQRTTRQWLEAGRLEAAVKPEDLDKPLGVFQGPGSVTVLVGGGAAGGFSAVIPLWGGGAGSRSVTRPIRQEP